MPEPTPPRRFRFGLRSLFVLVTVVAVACVLALNLYKRVNALGSRDDYYFLAKNVALAIYEYEQKNGAFPPAQYQAANGTVHSWRVLLLPYLERVDPKRYKGAQLVYDQYSFSEHWDGPNNKRLFESATNFYACDSRLGTGECNIFAVVDPQTAWPPRGRVTVKDIRNYRETIILVQSYGAEVPWMEPRDLSVDDVLAIYAERCQDDGKYHGIFQATLANGSAGHDLDDYCGRPEELLRRLTIADEPPSQAAELLNQHQNSPQQSSRPRSPARANNPLDVMRANTSP